MTEKKRALISQNLIAQAESLSGAKFEIIKKVCDFCARDLLVEHESKQCRACPTIFDECSDCVRDKPRIDTSICHKSHTGAPLEDNAMLSEEERQMILNREKSVFLSVFGLSLQQRHHRNVCGYCATSESQNSESQNAEKCYNYAKIDVTESFAADKYIALLPCISDLARNKGVKIFVRMFCDGYLIDFAQ